MNDPAIFQIVSGVILGVVLILLMAPRKRPARGLNPKTRASAARKREMDPTYCFRDCVRIQGQSRDTFCGVACGLKGRE